MTEPAPTRSYEVDLPIGLTEGGELHRRAVVRKMRGHEEALLYDRELGPGELVSRILAGAMLRLGSIEAPGPEVVDRMYSADRNFLLLHIRRLTLGDGMPAHYRCPGCGSEVRTLARISDIPVRSVGEGEDPELVTVPLEDGYVDRQGKEHTEVTLRLPRGEDEVFVSSLVERDPVKAADALVLRCVRSFGTLPAAEVEAYGLRILRDLALGDRLHLQRALSDDAPGARLRTLVRCDNCDTRFERMLDVSDFFVPRWAEDPAYGKRSSTSRITSAGPGARS